jgi:hypothetical protein
MKLKLILLFMFVAWPFVTASAKSLIINNITNRSISFELESDADSNGNFCLNVEPKKFEISPGNNIRIRVTPSKACNSARVNDYDSTAFKMTSWPANIKRNSDVETVYNGKFTTKPQDKKFKDYICRPQQGTYKDLYYCRQGSVNKLTQLKLMHTREYNIYALDQPNVGDIPFNGEKFYIKNNSNVDMTYIVTPSGAGSNLPSCLEIEPKKFQLAAMSSKFVNVVVTPECSRLPYSEVDSAGYEVLGYPSKYNKDKYPERHSFTYERQYSKSSFTEQLQKSGFICQAKNNIFPYTDFCYRPYFKGNPEFMVLDDINTIYILNGSSLEKCKRSAPLPHNSFK